MNVIQQHKMCLDSFCNNINGAILSIFPHSANTCSCALTIYDLRKSNLHISALLSVPNCQCLTVSVSLSIPCCRCLTVGALLTMPYYQCLTVNALLPVPYYQCLAISALLSMPCCQWRTVNSNAVRLKVVTGIPGHVSLVNLCLGRVLFHFAAIFFTLIVIDVESYLDPTVSLHYCWHHQMWWSHRVWWHFRLWCHHCSWWCHRIWWHHMNW